MSTLIALLLLAQTLSPDVAVRAYTVVDANGGVVLAMPTGRYSVELSDGAMCQDVVPYIDVDVVAGSGGVATISPAGHGELCEALVTGIVSDVPCAADALGRCDIASEIQEDS